MDKWAGDFECSSCRRKRLIAAEFSSAMIAKFRADGGAIRCKACVASDASQDRVAAEVSALKDTGEIFECAACSKALTSTAFNKNQLKKGASKRCKGCVDSAEAASAAQSSEAQLSSLAQLEKAAKDAEASGSALQRATTAAALAAAEAKLVTGLKPIVMGRGYCYW